MEKENICNIINVLRDLLLNMKVENISIKYDNMNKIYFTDNDDKYFVYQYEIFKIEKDGRPVIDDNMTKKFVNLGVITNKNFSEDYSNFCVYKYNENSEIMN